MYITKTRNISNLNDFNEEAKAHNSKIEIVLKFGAEELRFQLSEALDAQEELDLDAFIAAYIDVDPELYIPKIYDLVKNEARHKHHHNIDYKTDIASGMNLIPKRTVSQGEVTKVDWYKSLDETQTPIDLVLTVDIAYTRDATGFATFRNTVRTWINRDESENADKKYTSKFYFVNPSDMITEGYRRRKLLVQSIQIPSMQFMMEVLMPLGYTQQSIILQGRAFMDDYEGDFSRFIENSSTITNPSDPNVGKKTIVVALEDTAIEGRNADYNVWLDKAPASLGGMVTIRQYLIGEFSI